MIIRAKFILFLLLLTVPFKGFAAKPVDTIEVQSFELNNIEDIKKIDSLVDQFRKDKLKAPNLKHNTSIQVDSNGLTAEQNKIIDALFLHKLPDIKKSQTYESFIANDLKSHLHKLGILNQILDSKSRITLTVVRALAYGLPTYWSFNISESYTREAAMVIGIVAGSMSGFLQYKAELYTDFLAKKVDLKKLSISQSELSSNAAGMTKWYATEVAFMSLLQVAMILTPGGPEISLAKAAAAIALSATLGTLQQGPIENIASLIYNKTKFRINRDFIKSLPDSKRDSFLTKLEYLVEVENKLKQNPNEQTLITKIEEQKSLAIQNIMKSLSQEELFRLYKMHRKPELYVQLTMASISFVSAALITSMLADVAFFNDPFPLQKISEYLGINLDSILKSVKLNSDSIKNSHVIITSLGAIGLYYYYKVKSYIDNKSEKKLSTVDIKFGDFILSGAKSCKSLFR